METTLPITVAATEFVQWLNHFSSKRLETPTSQSDPSCITPSEKCADLLPKGEKNSPLSPEELQALRRDANRNAAVLLAERQKVSLLPHAERIAVFTTGQRLR